MRRIISLILWAGCGGGSGQGPVDAKPTDAAVDAALRSPLVAGAINPNGTAQLNPTNFTSSRTGTGQYVLHFPAGTWSSLPWCTVTDIVNQSAPVNMLIETDNGGGAATVSIGFAADTLFNFICADSPALAGAVNANGTAQNNPTNYTSSLSGTSQYTLGFPAGTWTSEPWCNVTPIGSTAQLIGLFENPTGGGAATITINFSSPTLFNFMCAQSGKPVLAGGVNANGTAQMPSGYTSMMGTSGAYILNFPAGTWTSTPWCIVTPIASSATYVNLLTEVPAANGSATVNIGFNAAAIFNFICAQD